MTTKDNDGTASFVYRFWLPDNSQREFAVGLEPSSLRLVCEKGSELPGWARLDFHKCPNCTLDSRSVEYCPAAAGLVDLVEFFQNISSHEVVDVCVFENDRKHVKRTAVQHLVSSLAGIIISASACPVLGKMRPLIRSYVPFPTPVENVHRVVSLYLLEQHIVLKRGGEPDWGLKGLLNYFIEMEIVIGGLCRRLNSVRVDSGDACLNAINEFNNLGILARLAIEDEDFSADAVFSEGSWAEDTDSTHNNKGVR